MKKIRLDSILLFTFVVPFIMTYRLSSGETPYWLFGLIFLLLLLYVGLDVFSLKEKMYIYAKRFFLLLIIIAVIGSTFSASIIVRHQTSPTYMIHDIIIQQESAIRFLLHGKNPYSVTYFGTPLEQWNYDPHEINPALYHFVLEPLYLIFAIPFYILSSRTIGFFDGRIPLLLLFLVAGICAFLLPKKEDNKRRFTILLLFSPALLPYVLEGRSDIFMYGFFLLSLVLLKKKKLILSVILLASSFAVKQSIWFIFPFYFYYLFQTKRSLHEFIKSFLAFAVSVAILILPFFLWDPKAYIDSTILYLSGTAQHSYPISGYGLGMVLHSFGLIRDIHEYYPFVIWQFFICLPLLLVLLRYQRKHQKLSTAIFLYGVFLFVYWYLSRYFNNSHVAYLSLVFTTAYFLQEEIGIQ